MDRRRNSQHVLRKVVGSTIILVLIILSSCAMNDTIEEVGSRESLIVLKWQFGISNFNVRNDVMDQALIEDVETVFAQVDWQEDDGFLEAVEEGTSQFDWDFQEDEEDGRPIPEYRIGNYNIWIIDEFVHAVNLEGDTYAKLTEEDSEFILNFVIGVFH